MADRLTDLVIGLHRMAENAHIRGVDIEYSHREEINEYVKYLDQLLELTEKLHNSLLADRKRFMPAEADRNRQLQQENTAAYVHQLQQKPKQGPKEAAG